MAAEVVVEVHHPFVPSIGDPASFLLPLCPILGPRLEHQILSTRDLEVPWELAVHDLCRERNGYCVLLLPRTPAHFLYPGRRAETSNQAALGSYCLTFVTQSIQLAMVKTTGSSYVFPSQFRRESKENDGDSSLHNDENRKR